MSKPKRLHPIAAAVNFLKQLKELIIPFFAIVVFGGNATNWDLFYFIASTGIVLVVLVTGIVTWLRFTYRIEDGELRIEYGMFVKKKRYIPIERIQSLDLSEGILHRPFGLVRVKVETAGSSSMGLEGAEAVLAAVSKAEAMAIQDVITSVKKMHLAAVIGDMPKEEFLYKITPKELLLLASTSGGAGVVISAAFAFLFQFEELVPYKKLFKEFASFAANGAVVIGMIVFFAFLLAWLIALIGTMIKYANFTVKKVENDLIISRGLLEKRQLTIPVDRIQAVRVTENLIRQPFGFATVFVESAGGSAANVESARVMVLPIIKKGQIAERIGPYLPDYKINIAYNPAPARAIGRYLMKGWLPVLPVVLAAILFLRPWGFLSLLLATVGACWSYLTYKDAGWNIDQQQLTLRYRGIVKHTVFMRKNKIQSLSIKESCFQRRKKLSTVKSVVKSGRGGTGGTVFDLDQQEADRIYQWYSGDSRTGNP